MMEGKHKEGFEKFIKDLSEGQLPEFENKLLDVINVIHDVWGPWEDEGPYYVKADNRTIEDAAKLLQQCGFEDMCVFAETTEVMVKEVWDCAYDDNKPCSEQNCRHNHTENVYQFYVCYEEEISDEEKGCIVVYPDKKEAQS